MSTFVLCAGCGEPLYDFSPCRWCTCERCGNDLLNGFCSYCNSRNSYVYDPNPNSFDCPPDSYHPSHPTYETYSYDSSSVPQQYPCCTRCGGPHETCQCDQLIFDEPYFKHCEGPHMNFQCQPMNQNSYNSNSPGFDQPQPQPPQSPVIHQPPQEMSIQEMEDLKQQYLDEMKHLINSEYRDENKITKLNQNFNGMSIEINKKEKLLQLEQWANLCTYPSKRFNSFCYDDDDEEEYTIAVTPSLSTEEPDNSLSMGDEHLDTIPATKADEFIKSSDFSDSNDAFSLTDDDSFSIDNIDYVEASPPDSELVSSKVMEIVIPEVGGIDDDIISTIKDDILREILLNVNLLIAKIEALNDNPTLSFDFKTKSSSTSLNSLLEETNNFDNSLPEFETFCFDVEEISSGSTTTRSDISLFIRVTPLFIKKTLCHNHGVSSK
nr:hypothetical protein [Tanacetum cinerariifolium]